MRSRVLLVGLLVGLLAPFARAVVIAGGTGTEHTTDPGGGLPWNYVGSVNGASGVFLGSYGGNNWVLTASHVVGSGSSLGDFTVDGGTFSFVPGSGIVVRNGDNSTTDLTLFRIATGPALAPLTLASSAPAFGSTVAMVGFGVRETSAQLFWNVTGSGAGTTWTQVTSSDPWNASGYSTGSSGTERWGLVTTIDPSTQSLPSTYNVGTGVTESLVTQFRGIGGYSQAGGGDSGGALFYDTGSGWALAGILGAIDTFTNQPANTAVFTSSGGDLTYAGSIANYNSFIVSTIPEPADVAAGLGAIAIGFAVWRRRRCA